MSFEKGEITLPKSSILRVEICEPVINQRLFTPYGMVDAPEMGTALRLDLSDAVLPEMMKTARALKEMFFRSQLIYVSGNYRTLYIKSAPVGGLKPLLEELERSLSRNEE